jgi:hypothetical protein
LWDGQAFSKEEFGVQEGQKTGLIQGPGPIKKLPPEIEAAS